MYPGRPCGLCAEIGGAFHTSSRPSLSLFLTVVLTMTAPQATHPWLLVDGMTSVVAEAASSPTGFVFGSGKVQVTVSQVP